MNSVRSLLPALFTLHNFSFFSQHCGEGGGGAKLGILSERTCWMSPNIEFGSSLRRLLFRFHWIKRWLSSVNWKKKLLMAGHKLSNLIKLSFKCLNFHEKEENEGFSDEYILPKFEWLLPSRRALPNRWGFLNC